MAGYSKVNLKDDVEDQAPNFELGPFDALRVHTDTTRGFEGGPEGAELIAVGAPNTGPGDAEVENNWWDD